MKVITALVLSRVKGQHGHLATAVPSREAVLTHTFHPKTAKHLNN